MVKTETEKEMMNRLYKEYGLSSDNIFKHKHYTIITRAGMDKIQAKANIEISYKPIECLCNPNESIATFLVKGTKFDDQGEVVAVMETTGEASPDNNKNGYFVAIAEKRGMARVVLKLAGLYGLNVFSEDEADDFKQTVKDSREMRSRKAVYKGN